MTGLIILIVIVIVVVIIAIASAGKQNNRSHPGESPSATQSAVQYSGPQRSLSRPIEAPRAVRPLTWLGPATELRIAGMRIAGPLTYASTRDAGEYLENKDPSEIDTSLRVTFGDSSEGLPYWPSYSMLSDDQRGVYVRWLASGRTAWPSDDGYAFIYMYGLERRALLERADRALIAAELLRLRKMEAARAGTGNEGRSFRRYTAAFLWFLAADSPTLFQPTDIRQLVEATQPTDDQALASLVGWFATKGMSLPNWAAFTVAAALPASQRSVVIKRVPEEFNRLFEKRFGLAYPGGMALRVSKATGTIDYRPASAALTLVTAAVPNAWGLPSQFRPLSEIWNSCVEDLRQLSKAEREEDGEALSIEGWEALPAELQAETEHPLTKQVCVLVAERTTDGGCALPLGRLAELAGVPARAKLTLAQSTRLVESLEHVGYCVEPDPRVFSKGYGWDEMVAMFPRWDESQPDTGRYQAAALMLRMGISVAQADGAVDADERSKIISQVEEAFNLTAHEKRRLEALRHLLETSKGETGQTSKKLVGSMEPLVRQAVGRLLVAIAAADGVITRDELGVLKRGFRNLDLPIETLDRTIAEVLPSGGDDMVTVQPATSGPIGEAIPQTATPAPQTLRLNREAIQSIMMETRQVSALLAAAMQNSEGGAAAAQQPNPSIAAASSFPSPQDDDLQSRTRPDSSRPPTRYVAFYDELTSRPRWTRDEAEALALKHSVMLAGAVESVNEWAFDSLGYAVVDDSGGDLVVDPEGI